MNFDYLIPRLKFPLIPLLQREVTRCIDTSRSLLLVSINSTSTKRSDPSILDPYWVRSPEAVSEGHKN